MNSEHENRRCVLDIETTGFNPWTGRIICIGIMDVRLNDVTIFHDNHEETLLIQFLKYFNKMEFGEIIGFNIGFDIRFIIGRCLRYKLPASAFYEANSTDLMMILKGFKRTYNFNRPGTLDEWAGFLLGKRKLLKSSSVPMLYRQGRIDEILDYNRNDVQLTYELWDRINSVVGKVDHGA